MLNNFLHIVYLYISDAILCYQCSDAQDNAKCKEDIDGQLSEYQKIQNMTDLTDTQFHRNFEYLKNCTQDWGDRCLIEKIHEAGKSLSLYQNSNICLTSTITFKKNNPKTSNEDGSS
jgi:hypothetical protein